MQSWRRELPRSYSRSLEPTTLDEDAYSHYMLKQYFKWCNDNYENL